MTTGALFYAATPVASTTSSTSATDAVELHDVQPLLRRFDVEVYVAQREMRVRCDRVVSLITLGTARLALTTTGFVCGPVETVLGIVSFAVTGRRS